MSNYNKNTIRIDDTLTREQYPKHVRLFYIKKCGIARLKERV